MNQKRSGIRDRKSRGTLAAVTAILLLVTGNFTGCEPENLYWNVDCNSCIDFRPDSTELIIYLTINQENDSVPLTIYKGNSDGELFRQDTATGPKFYVMAAIGPTYTVMAEYRSGPRTILAFDADEMHLTDYGAECGNPCYIVKGGIYDLELKE
jgi:hypothetical protein